MKRRIREFLNVLLFLRNDDDEYLAGRDVRMVVIPGSEGAWTRSPFGPRTLEENLRIAELSRRRQAQRRAV